MFEAHNVIRESLEHRMQILNSKARAAAQFRDLSMEDETPGAVTQIFLEVRNLRDIAIAKCDHLVKEIAGIVKEHLQTPFFEWDASLVRGELLISLCKCPSPLIQPLLLADGIYYVGTLLAESGGADYDIACCVQALSEMRWAFAKSYERTEQ